MPTASTPSGRSTGRSILAELGEDVRRAVDEHKNAAPTMPDMELPPGIEGGIAQLRRCGIIRVQQGKPNAGKPMFFASAVCKSPDQLDGRPCAGLSTRITEPLYDTPTRTRKTTTDHLVWIQDLVKRLLGPNFDPEMVSVDALESTMRDLEQVAPHFYFRTWQGTVQTTGPYANKPARTNHDWGGPADWREDAGAPAGAVVDRTGARASTSGNGAAANNRAAPPPDADDHAEESSFDEMGSIAALVGQALGNGPKSGEAEDRLAEMAKAAGMTDEQIRKAADWREVGDFILSSTGTEDMEGGDAEGEDEEGGPEGVAEAPEKGQNCRYKVTATVLDKKTKKRVNRTRTIDAEITTVNQRAETCTLKGDDGQTYTNVPWSELIWEEE